MPKIQFQEEDVKGGYLVKEPGWYEYVVGICREKPAKSNPDKTPSTNYWLSVLGKSGEMLGVEVLSIFNSKLLKLASPFFVACNGGKPLEAHKDYEFDNCKGLIVEGYTERGMSQQGNPINKIIDWRTKS